jgi:hypothetical protein
MILPAFRCICYWGAAQFREPNFGRADASLSLDAAYFTLISKSFTISSPDLENASVLPLGSESVKKGRACNYQKAWPWSDRDG